MTEISLYLKINVQSIYKPNLWIKILNFGKIQKLSVIWKPFDRQLLDIIVCGDFSNLGRYGLN